MNLFFPAVCESVASRRRKKFTSIEAGACPFEKRTSFSPVLPRFPRTVRRPVVNLNKRRSEEAVPAVVGSRSSEYRLLELPNYLDKICLRNCRRGNLKGCKIRIRFTLMKRPRTI